MEQQAGHVAQGNESRIRVVAFLVLLLSVTYLFKRSIWIPLFLTADFFCRAFDLGRFSPIATLSGLLVRAFRFPFKPVYLPPKRFAARVGLSFFVLIVILQLNNVNAVIPAVVICIFAVLESVFNICAGCYAYNLLIKLRVLR